MTEIDKNIPSLYRLIEDAPLSLLRPFFTHPDHPACLQSLLLPLIAHTDNRCAIASACLALDIHLAELLDEQARRILALSTPKGLEALKLEEDRLYLYEDPAHPLAQAYRSHHDPIARAMFLYLYAPTLFAAAEKNLYQINERADNTGTPSLASLIFQPDRQQATLYLAGRAPLPLTGQKLVMVDRLFRGYRSGNPVLTNKTLFWNLGYNHPKQAFPHFNWHVYFGHPPNKKQGWMLYV